MSNKDYLARLGDRRYDPAFRKLMTVTIPEFLAQGPGGRNYPHNKPLSYAVDLWFDKLVKFVDECTVLRLNSQAYPTVVDWKKDYALTAEYHSKGATRQRFIKYWWERLELLGWSRNIDWLPRSPQPMTHAQEMERRAFRNAICTRYGVPKDQYFPEACCD